MANSDALELVLNAATGKFDKGVSDSEKQVVHFSETAKSRLGSVGDVFNALQRQGSDLSHLWGSLIGAIAGGDLLTFMRSFVTAAADEQARIEGLNTALDDLNVAGAGAGERLAKFAEALGMATGYDVPKLVQGMTELAQMGMNEGQIKWLTELATNLAALRHMDISRVFRLLERGISSGTPDTFRRLGLTMQDVKKAGGDLDKALQLLWEHAANAAQQHAGTYEGALARLRTIAETVKASFGTGLLNLFGDLANKTITFLEYLKNLSPSVKGTLTAIAAFAGGLLTLVAVLPLALKAVIWLRDGFAILIDTLAVIASPGVLLFAAFAAGVVAAVASIATHWSTFQQAIMSSVDTYLAPALKRLSDALAPIRQRWADFVGGLAGSDGLANTIASALGNLIQILAGAIDFISSHLGVIHAFADVLVFVASTSVIGAVIGGLRDLRVALMASNLWAGVTLAVEAFSAVLRVGMLTAIRGAIVALWDLVGAEAAATVGLSLIAVGIVELLTHLPQARAGVASFAEKLQDFHDRTVVGFYAGLQHIAEALAHLAHAFADFVQGIERQMGPLAALFPQLDAAAKGYNALGDAAETAAQKMRDTAQAERQASQEAAADRAVFKYGTPEATQAANDELDFARQRGARPGVAPAAPKDTVPAAPFPGGFDAFEKPKAAKDGASKAAQNALENLKQRIEDMLEPYLARIEAAKTWIDKLDARKAQIQSHVDDKKGPTQQQSRDLDKIDADRARAEMELKARYLQQVKAEYSALAQLEAMRSKIAGNSKLQEQYRELSAAIDTVKGKIGQLGVEAIKSETAAAQAANDAKKRHEEEAQRAEEAIRQEVAHANAIRDVAKAQADLARAQARAQASVAGARTSRTDNVYQDAQSKAGEAQANVTDANAGVAAAVQAVADAARIAAANPTDQEAQQDKLKADQELLQAQAQLVTATAGLTVAQIEQARVIKQAENAYTPLVQKFQTGVPILNTFIQALQNAKNAAAAGAAAANPLAVAFVALLEQTKTFKELQEIINNLFQVLAKIIDAILLPVLKVVSQVLTFVANGFITLYNIVAQLANVFGIHMQRLSYINSLLDNLSGAVKPLIDVVHDLPTLKQYGAGAWGNLSDAQGDSATNDPTLNAINSQTSTQVSWFQRIVSVGLLFLGIDWLTHGKFFSDMSVWFNQLNSKTALGFGEIVAGVSLLNTHSTGIIGVLERIVGILLTIQGAITALQGINASGGFGGLLGSLAGALGIGGAAAGAGAGAGIASFAPIVLASQGRHAVGGEGGGGGGPDDSEFVGGMSSLVSAVSDGSAIVSGISLLTQAVNNLYQQVTAAASGVGRSGGSGGGADGLTDKIANAIKQGLQNAGVGGSSSTTVNQNNRFGDVSGFQGLDEINDALGRALQIGTRTRRFALTR